MAPGRSSTRHPPISHGGAVHHHQANNNNHHVNPNLFIDPMLGTPLAMYVEKDVEDKDSLVDLIVKYGGTVSPGYSGVPYILVDPYKQSGQNLWRQYVGKKTKIVLDVRWVHECIKAGELQTFQTNWAGCKVTGKETSTPDIGSAPDLQPAPAPLPAPTTVAIPVRVPSPRRRARDPDEQQIQPPPPPPPTLQPPSLTPMTISSIVEAHQNGFPYPVYPHNMRPLHPAPPHPPPPQTWQQSVGIAPQQTHLTPPQPQALPTHLLHRPHHHTHEGWSGYDQHVAHTHAHTHQPAPEPLVGPSTGPFDYRYRDETAPWVGGPEAYYGSYDQGYGAPPYIEEPSNPVPGPSSAPEEPAEKRGRKRTRVQQVPTPSAASLVMNKKPPARSPSPPTRVIKSTYGGNLFTSDDVLYLKKYIEYCQEQGLVLSLREICERIAVKAPHHTFYSWRRYCNKHQIRLGGYIMNLDRGESPDNGMDEDGDIEEEQQLQANISLPSTASAALLQPPQRGSSQPIIAPLLDPSTPRDRSPTPPRALFRSTTGKGVAFTKADVTFLVRFMEYRKSQGRLDMVSFWKEVATKAPHHSRASWMKYWRRHKHELTREETDEPPPDRPEKKMRYSREDDVLLAKYFFEKPEGTSDKVFQAFARLYSHHPWKGWQEHHRIHKAKIDHFIEMLARGESLDDSTGAEVGGNGIIAEALGTS